MAGRSSKPTQPDSFSDLTSLMKAKKPYRPTLQHPPKPQLPFASEHLQSTSRKTTASSPAKPGTTPFKAPESAADFLEREEVDSAKRSPETTRDCEFSMQRLDSLFEQFKKVTINGTGTADHSHTTLPRYQSPLFIPGLESPVDFGPKDLLTPADSGSRTASPFLSEAQPVVRLAKHVYDSLCRALESLEKDKLELQTKVQKLEKQLKNSRGEDDEVGTRVGLLKYQNEANRTQKADMGRALSEKELKIKTQQLEIDDLQLKLIKVETEAQAISSIIGERDYLRDTLSSVHDQHAKALEEVTTCKDQELEQIRNTLREVQATLAQVTSERDAASRARLNTSNQAAREENLVEKLTKRERINTDLRQKILEEQLRVTQLEDEVEDLRARLCKDKREELEQQLREKTSLCDRQRSQLKMAEQHLKISEARVMRVSNNGDALTGAAHLVVPHANTKLPKNVVSCSECYANNLTCDAHAKCRSCGERDTPCARWRCSLKHKLGTCPLVPCKLPHDAQGWLMLQREARPQW
ncbi:hypothetical protein IAQ61_010649 [Plenodomus lingam]|uniref:uncharacterized protein n=1 Tax=Leptosphaeria maculans TaxID=5022 RepID=UPI0033319B2D|nr:hypothetical protein IAQ61_010649 [Plenodomus lingam]